MTKKRFLIAIAIVMVLILSVAVFVACNENQTKSYTVKFVDGESEVKSVSVEEGKTIADADVPADLTKDGYVFEGWYVGYVAFDKSAAITADVTYSAKWTKLHTVKFVDGDETIKTATVKDGEKIAASDIPADPTKEGYRFNGWFVGDTKITADYTVNDSVIAIASFTIIGKEAGTYTDKAGVGAELVLDGIDSGTLGGVTISYTINGDIVTIGEDMYKLVGSEYIINDKMAGAYSHTIEGAWGGTVTFTLDGYGNVVGTEVAGSYVAEPENGTYIVANGKLAMTFPNYSYWDCEYTIKADGNVLSSVDSTTNEEVAYIKAGYVVPTAPADAFTGLWIAADGSIIEIAVENGVATVKEAGVVVDGCFFNWDYSVLSVPIQNSYYNDSYAVVDGKLVKNGETQYTKSNASDIRVSVKFVVDGSTVATAQTTYGQAISPNDIPEDPTAELGYSFRGWFSGDVEFNEDALVYTDVTYTAKFEQTQAIVSFVNGTETVSTIAVDFGAKFASNQIPAAPSGNGVFLGWYCGTSKAESGSAIKSGMNVVYTALFVNQDSYQGAFVDKTNGVMAVFTADGKVSVMGISNKVWNYDSETGSAVYTEGSRLSKNTYTMTRVGDALALVHTYFDIYGDPASDNYTLEKANGTISGTFYKSRTSYMVVQDGAITYMGGDTYYAFITKAGSNVSIKWKSNATSAMQSVRGKISEDGTITIAQAGITANGIWVKDPVERKEFYNADLGYIYEFTTEDDIIYIYKDKDDVYTVASTDVLLTDGAIATITYGSKELIVKITGTNFIAASAERGTFTAEGKGSITFDGFGSATIGDKTYSYIVNKKGIVVLTGETTFGVTLDSEAKTYAEATGDGFAHAYIDESDSRYTLTFDGFGGVEYKYVGKYGSPQIAYGSYTLGAGSVTVKGADYFYDKTYSVEESGNVIVSTDGKKVLKTAGYVVESKIKSLEGYYVNGDSTIEIVVAEDKTFKLYVDGALVDAKANWNGSAITYSALDADAAIDSAKTSKTTFTISKDGDNIKVSHNCAVGLDMDGYIETAVKEATYTASTKPSAETDGLEGTYKSGSNVIVLDGKGNGTLNGVAFTYSGTGSTKQVSAFGAFNGSANTFTVTATGIDVSFDDEYQENAFKASFTKEAETLDAFAGTWKFGSVTFVFDGKGSVTVSGSYEGTYTYSIDAAGTTATFRNTAYYEDITCKLNSDGSMTVNDESSEWLNNAKFTKQA